MKKIYFLVILFTFTYLANSQTVELQSFGPSFSSPVDIAHAGDSRLFIVEQAGRIKILNTDGTVNTIPFLDIDNIVNSGGERGLLGLAFDPDYNSTGRFYVNYINSDNNTVIARYTVSSNPDVANTSGTILLTIDQPYGNHNGGKLAFGSDGFLYIATGDGGSGGDPQNRSQNNDLLLGKLLRIDVSGTNYTNPNTNPFVGTSGADEIWATGLRNPWKFSFDKNTGDLWIADVGQNAYEEINLASPTEAGINYGWRCREGMHNYDTSNNSCTGLTDPISEYNQGGTPYKCSITGGYIYRGNTYPAFAGKYFFADYCSQEIGILTNNGTSWDSTLQSVNETGNWTTFGEDANGELYIAGSGNLYKLIDPNLSVTNHTLNEFKMYPNPSKNSVSFKFNANFESIKNITFYTIEGKLVKQIDTIKNTTITVNTKNLNSGIYLVTINNIDGSNKNTKLIIN